MVARIDPQASPVPDGALQALARGVAAAAGRPTAALALADLAGAARTVAAADLALIRVSAGDVLEAAAVSGPAALQAELDGTHLAAADEPRAATTVLDGLAPVIRHTAQRAGARFALVVPVPGGGTLELYRASTQFGDADRAAGELVAAQVALVLRTLVDREPRRSESHGRTSLELTGEALAAAHGEVESPSQIVRVAASVVGAPVGLVWEAAGGVLELTGSFGLDVEADLATPRLLAEKALVEGGPIRAVRSEELPAPCTLVASLPLGQPASGVLQLFFPPDHEPDVDELGRLGTFGVRAAHALRAGARARLLAAELERTRALLAVVGQATAQLSLAHTLDTALDRVRDLLAVEAVAVYLLTEEKLLVEVAARGLAGPHIRVAERLLELAARGTAIAESSDIVRDVRLHDVRDAVAESDIEAALAIPLVVRGDVIGLLAVYPALGRRATPNERALLTAVAGQLAVAVQNAQLHEQATALSSQREAALASERESARRLGALYEISRSFAQELSLDKTLDALAQTIVSVLDIDAALILMPDERHELLTPRAEFIKDDELRAAAHAILSRAAPFGGAQVQRLFREAASYRIERGHELLEPFLAKGWTGAVVPVATPAETIAALQLYSFRPGDPITDETVDAALAIAGQAALAIDNARLYQQQKEFADTMQRSLLPRADPNVEGLEVGEVYESSARVDVGGDVYDFLQLEDGRLAVVLGDVTGHGVGATADMAMAKFVFRSLAREHPEPGEFLASANDVVVDEIAPGKFITMVYLAVDAARGEVACASAGHPPPRLVLPDGTVSGLDASGIVLGIDADQTYEEVRAQMPVGAAIVLYTDGVVEARNGGELYGIERLDALLAGARTLPVGELARAVTESARSYAGGELSDDLAVVVIRRTS